MTSERPEPRFKKYDIVVGDERLRRRMTTDEAHLASIAYAQGRKEALADVDAAAKELHEAWGEYAVTFYENGSTAIHAFDGTILAEAKTPTLTQAILSTEGA